MIDEARRIAEAAGELLLQRFGRLAGPEVERRGRRDVVTAADREAEAFIRRELGRADPAIPILGEEEDRGRDAQALAGPQWIVDPLDGTVNFVQGIPMFCVSIGLVEDGRPVLGVIHVPVLGQTFYGSPGSGAFENGRPISVSVCPVLEDAILATGFAYVRNEVADDNLDNVAHLGRVARGLRRMAAGAALVLAAGGRVSDQRGGDAWLFGRNIVATNGLLHAPLQGALAPLRDL